MKTNNQISKWLTMLLLVIASTMGVMGQTSTTLTQDVCPGTEPYFIHPSDKLSTFIWTISPGTSGTEWTISTPTDTITNIIWTNPAISSDFTVIFREIAPTGCDDWKSIIVTVNPLPAPVIAGSGTVCQNQTGVKYSTLDVAGNTYTWLVSGGIITAGATTNEITVAWDTAGNGTVEVTETVTATTCETTVNIPVLVNPAPEPVIAGLLTVCQNESGVIYSTPNTVTNTYSWVVTGGTITAGAGTNQITVTWTTVGAGTVEVTETVTSSTCATKVNIPVLVNPAPAPIIAGKLTACQNESGVTYSTPNDAANTYSWVVTGGTITAGAGTNQITVTWDTVGSGVVEVTETVTSSTCATTVTIPVLVNPAPEPIIAGKLTACQNESGVIYSTPNTVTNTYSWVVTGGTITAGASTNQITVTWDVVGSGIVEVTETVSSSICATKVNIPVLVNPVPKTSPIYHN